MPITFGPLPGRIPAKSQPGDCPEEVGIKMLADDVNAAGGVNGQKIIIKSYDDACDPKQAVSVANKIISENIHLALHGTCSASAIATLKTYADEGTVVINSISSNPKVTDEGGPHMFRAMYRDDKAAILIADYIRKNYPGKKIAIIHDKSAYGQGIAENVQKALNQNGTKEIIFESFDPANHDYSVLATRLKDMGTEVLFIGGYPVEGGLITRQMHDSGSKAQIIAGDLSAPEFWKIAGKTGEDAKFVFPMDPRKAPAAKAVIDRLQKAGVVVDGYTLYGYAAAQVLVQALTKVGSDDPSKIADFIHKNEFNTILGKWNFDAKGDVDNIHQVMFRWHDGQFEELKE